MKKYLKILYDAGTIAFQYTIFYSSVILGFKLEKLRDAHCKFELKGLDPVYLTGSSKIGPS